jgi:hypothetical protein
MIYKNCKNNKKFPRGCLKNQIFKRVFFNVS